MKTLLLLLLPVAFLGQSVKLAWDASIDPVAGYRVYRAQTPAVPIANPLAMVIGLTYLDPTPVVGSTYYYAVTAVGPAPESFESIQSNVVMAVAKVPQTSTLKAYFQGLASDRTGTVTTAPDGYPDWNFQVTGLRSNPAKIVMTMSNGRQWEAPGNPNYWVVLPEYPTTGAGNFWVSVAGEYESAHVKVWYADGSADETDSVQGSPPVTPPQPPQPPADPVPVIYFMTSDGSSFTSNTKVIDLHVADDKGVMRCELIVNGAVHASLTPSWRLSATTKFYFQGIIPKATYTLGASCYDVSGGKGVAAAITVTKK